MIVAQNELDEWIETSNNGTTIVEIPETGKRARANQNGFVHYMKKYFPEQMNRSYRVPTYNGKSKLESAEDIVKKSFEYLPASGKFVSEEKEYTVEQAMSAYLKTLDEEIPASFIQFMQQVEISAEYKKQFVTDINRIEEHYENKKRFISEVSNQIFHGKEIEHQPKSKVQITPKDIKKYINSFPIGWIEITETASKMSPKKQEKYRNSNNSSQEK